jgi:hypothetical protein
MTDILEKLRPDRDLQCYFERPSAIAALSEVSASGFRVTGTWRQQFDWAVVEWNQHNVFEHPAFRNLPDGDLSGLSVSYEETRTNCIALDSNLYPTVDWPYLRLWAGENSVEQFYRVRLRDYAEPVEGSYSAASAEIELQGTPTAGDYVGFSFLTEHHTYQINGIDTLESVVQALTDSVNAFSDLLAATRSGTRIRIYYVGFESTPESSTTGSDGNRSGLYTYTSGTGTAVWQEGWVRLTGGASPTKWRVNLDFSNLVDIEGRLVPTQAVRKMRWTYSAALQPGAFQRSEFEVVVSNWSVTGTNRVYRVAGPASRRIEDDNSTCKYGGDWTAGHGNFSGGSIRYTSTPGAFVECEYYCPGAHELFVGSRIAADGATIEVRVDGALVRSENLAVPGEDWLLRLPLGACDPGAHKVEVRHAGPNGALLYLDFVEIAVPVTALPEFVPDNSVTLATDWDTDHSVAIAPERTAWMIHSLGFHGRVNHYVGALIFYELVRDGHQYASATINFEGTPVFSETTQLRIGSLANPAAETELTHLNTIGDTAATVARAFELTINSGSTGIRAEADGTRLTIYARAMGTAGHDITVSATPTAGGFRAVVSSPTLSGGVDGSWHTDLKATPRLNRAVRDWNRSFYKAAKSYGLDCTAAFSMELQHGDPSWEAGIAQRYPSGDPALLNTPALQTNFSLESTTFWKDVYLGEAQTMTEAGLQPYLQFGEVQWWYFPQPGSGMPFYDEYTMQEFARRYGRPMALIESNSADPATFADEADHLATLIGEYTSAVIAHVKATYPDCRFEVLYPNDVNEFAFNRSANYPSAHWTPNALNTLKTESFTYTFIRDLDKALTTIQYPAEHAFPRGRRSFLVGVMDTSTAWLKEIRLAKADGVGSIVIWALDQYCLIGFPVPFPSSARRSVRLAS